MEYLTEDQKKKYIEEGVTHVLHVTDKFDYSNYDVPVKSDALFEEVRERYNGNMQHVNGVTVLVDQDEYQRTYEERLRKVSMQKLKGLMEFRDHPEELKNKMYTLGEIEAKALLEYFIKNVNLESLESVE